MRDWLCNLRKSANLSQKEVAGKLGITVQYYSYIENGKRQVDLRLLMASKLSDIFAVPLSTICEYEAECLPCKGHDNR